MSGETRQKILEATEKLIQIRGLARVTTKAIARETGLSEGALYRHFGHKEEVFFAIVQKYLPVFLATLSSHMAGTGEVTENLAAIALAAIEYYGKLIPTGTSFLADAELLEEYRQTLRELQSGPTSFFIPVAAYIEEEQTLGRIEARVPALILTFQLLGPCFQYEFFRQFTGDLPFGQSEQEFVESLIQGLGPALFTFQ